ncbi:MAG: hypothetical protein R3D59_12025 [Paracoccaceae bacterium]
MKTAIFTAAVAAIGFAAPAMAWNETGYAVQCYDETYVRPDLRVLEEADPRSRVQVGAAQAGQLVRSTTRRSTSR